MIQYTVFYEALGHKEAVHEEKHFADCHTIPKMIEVCELSYNKISNMNVMKFSRREGVNEYLSTPLAMSHIHAAHNVEQKMVA